MLRQTSASERLKGVLTSTTLDRPDPEVTAVLVETLRHDPNVNVRLSAVDALKRMSGDQNVRRGFAESLVASDSPLVQIALIDALMENPAVARDPQAANAFRTVAMAKQGEAVVKQRARLALERLEKRED
jgi:HEAT repeat protein